MKKRLLQLLKCPICSRHLTLTSDTQEEEIMEGALNCTCGKQYPVNCGVPRFLDSDAYVGSFSFEWKTHNKTQLDVEKSNASEVYLTQKTGLQPKDVKGKIVLDAGCGIGRFVDVIQKWGGEVVGVDLSYSVDSAYANVGRRPGVNIIQADILNLPFHESAFDIIFSVGVLHHTPDCKKAFLALPQYLKSGGLFCIWVYSNHNKIHTVMSVLLRKVTVRIPNQILYYLCFISIPLYYIYKIPVIGHLLRNFFPISMQKKCHWRLLDTFDWYSPKFQSKHSYPEVHEWFKDAGFVNMDLFEPPLGMRGQKG